MRRLWQQCDQAKRTLSATASAVIEVDNIGSDLDYSCSITRAKFEELNRALFSKSMRSVERVLKDGGVAKGKVGKGGH
jgi:molecular chaperone DnaK (HSP70)